MIRQRLIAAMRETLDSKTLEPAFCRAGAGAAERRADIARDIGEDIDHDAIFTARRYCGAQSASALQPRLLDVYSSLRLARALFSGRCQRRTPHAPQCLSRLYRGKSGTVRHRSVDAQSSQRRQHDRSAWRRFRFCPSTTCRSGSRRLRISTNVSRRMRLSSSEMVHASRP